MAGCLCGLFGCLYVCLCSFFCWLIGLFGWLVAWLVCLLGLFDCTVLLVDLVCWLVGCLVVYFVDSFVRFVWLVGLVRLVWRGWFVCMFDWFARLSFGWFVCLVIRFPWLACLFVLSVFFV